ncbi:glycosyltransferase [Citrus sinensis]|nr:glycosyltransferase [Citrus sinensis]
MTFGGGGFAISHRWFYVGSNSEGYEQNAKHSFDMTFGGGGFAISHSLARVLGRALDFCLMRYAHLYGSDARAFSCLVELGVGLNPEPSFHQLDMRGDMFCLLSQALQHLFKAVNVDPAGILQQTVCYDESSLLTVSVAWGYAIEVYEGNQLLPDLLSLWRTFTSWRRGSNVESHFMFNLRDYPSDPFKRPIVFFLESVLSDNNSMQSNYVKHVVGNCARADLVRKMEKIRVFSEKLELDVEEVVMNWFNRLDYNLEVNISKYSKVNCLVMPFSYSILF